MTPVPDSPVPITGYRVWGVMDLNGSPRLQSATAGFCGGATTWEPHEAFQASCLALQSCGCAPNPLHNCGVHSFRALHDALIWARKVSRVRPVVLGRVRSWGTVVEAQRGWRSQFAYPLDLFSDVAHRDLKPLAAAYGIALSS